jgi:hypothetical protein
MSLVLSKVHELGFKLKCMSWVLNKVHELGFK